MASLKTQILIVALCFSGKDLFAANLFCEHLLEKARAEHLRIIQQRGLKLANTLDDPEARVMHPMLPRPLLEFLDDNVDVDFFHGSSSASLLAFASEDGIGLQPYPVLKSMEVISLSGELAYGISPNGINQIGMSIVPRGKFFQAFRHASALGRDSLWGFYDRHSKYSTSIERKKADITFLEARLLLVDKHIDRDLKQRLEMQLEILNKQITRLMKIENDASELAKFLTLCPFPVVFGAKLNSDKNVYNSWSFGGTYNFSTQLVDSVLARDLGVIFVPKQKIATLLDFQNQGLIPRTILFKDYDAVDEMLRKSFTLRDEDIMIERLQMKGLFPINP